MTYEQSCLSWQSSFHHGSGLPFESLCDSLATSSRFQASSELATIFDACFYKLCPLVKGIEGWRWAQDTDITIISVSVSELPYQTSSAHFVLLITEYCDLVVSKSKLKITPLTENS